jgi:hypothetical protein
MMTEEDSEEDDARIYGSRCWKKDGTEVSIVALVPSSTLMCFS